MKDCFSFKTLFSCPTPSIKVYKPILSFKMQVQWDISNYLEVSTWLVLQHTDMLQILC